VPLDADDKTVQVGFMSQPEKANINAHAAFESHKEILVRATTEDKQTRDMMVTLTVCGTEQIKTRLNGMTSAKFILPISRENNGRVTWDLS
jgi:hypothetical protein